MGLSWRWSCHQLVARLVSKLENFFQYVLEKQREKISRVCLQVTSYPTKSYQKLKE